MRHSERMRNRMAGDRSTNGFLGRYFAWMQNESDDGPDAVEDLHSDIAEIFSTEQGVRVLLLLEKAVLLSSAPDGSDDRALREKNAVSNFVLELRRYATHGHRRSKPRK